MRAVEDYHLFFLHCSVGRSIKTFLDIIRVNLCCSSNRGFCSPYYSWAQADRGPITTQAFVIAAAGEEDMADCTLTLHASA